MENILDSKLISLAIEASKKSYSPYSTKQVGAAVLWDDGQITTGTNIENASYGATVCAERVAIWKKLSENNQAKICKVIVYIDEKQAWPPCGMCRQVISEFVADNAVVIYTNGKDHKVSSSFEDIFPSGFKASYLKA